MGVVVQVVDVEVEVGLVVVVVVIRLVVSGRLLVDFVTQGTRRSRI